VMHEASQRLAEKDPAIRQTRPKVERPDLLADYYSAVCECFTSVSEP
jgi:hypothetical protein